MAILAMIHADPEPRYGYRGQYGRGHGNGGRYLGRNRGYGKIKPYGANYGGYGKKRPSVLPKPVPPMATLPPKVRFFKSVNFLICFFHLIMTLL